MMGAKIVSQGSNGQAPLEIHGRRLHGIHYRMPIASAQV
jgi:3-phosphoshikimate 1-carboxyvinyltransferase